MGLIPILLISADLDPSGAPFDGEMPFIPLSDWTSKAASGVTAILSFITRSFTLICEGTPDAHPLSESHNMDTLPTFSFHQGG